MEISNFLHIALSLTANLNEHGMSKPPCDKSAECRYLPVTVQSIVSPLLRKAEHNEEILRGKCPTVALSPWRDFTTATANVSRGFPTSLTVPNSSPITGSQIAL